MQQVNLYRNELRAAKVVLPSRVIVPAVLILALVMTAVCSWMHFQISAPRQEADRLQSEADLKENAQEELSASLRQRVRDEALVRRADALEAQLRALGRLTEAIAIPRGAAPLPDFLLGLGRSRPENLWLTEIRIADGGRSLLLQGHTFDAALVPEYLQALGSEPAYSGLSFSHFTMRRGGGNDAFLDFTVATRDVPVPEGTNVRAARGPAFSAGGAP